MKFGIGSAFVVAMMAVSIPVWSADPPADDTEHADTLFEEGRTLMERGALPEACAKLEQSFQLAPRLGTMLNLGSCFERSGRLARALAIYERAATMARDAGRPDREQAARELSVAIERRVAKLLLVVDDRSPGATIEIDGEPMSTRGGLTPIDPGPHHVVVRAPDKRAWTTTLASEAGATVRLTVPQLEAQRPSSPTPAAPDSPGNPGRTIGVVGGLGVAAIGATLGTVFGLRAKSKRDDSSSSCDAQGCDRAGLALIADAKSAGNVSTGAFIGAGIGLATAGVFAFLVPSTHATVGLAPSATGTSIRLHASF